MFICKECADRVGWTYHLNLSKGPCELCERVRVCDDIKRPAQKANFEEMRAIEREAKERRASDK